MFAPDPIPPERRARLIDLAAIARLLQRPRRLRVACRSPLLIRRCGWRL